MNQKTKAIYTATIGIETHVQLKTKTKLFSATDNDAREAPVNTLISHIDVGMPGSLPVLNEKALELATRAAFALGTVPEPFSKFDRKHYFYPDLPKGYQITQYDQPIILGGKVTLIVDGKEKVINITRAHLEEDAGKSTHPAHKTYSLVDLNRAGTPLLEIVSEPEMHSAEEAKAYAHELWLLMKYANVSEANLYYGNMRFDVNVSVSKVPGKLGTRAEIKNLNSFKSVEKAVEFEIERQVKLLEAGEVITQETRGWDDTKLVTFSQRSKEEAHDYRYFPDPDLPPIELDESFINTIKKDMPAMPADWRRYLNEADIDSSQTETLIEAHADMDNVGYMDLIEGSLGKKEFTKQLVNWLVNIDIPYVREHGSVAAIDRAYMYSEISKLAKDDKISSTKTKQLIQALLHEEYPPKNISEFAEKNGFMQMSDSAEIEAIVQKIINDNAKAAEDIKHGETKAIGFLVGQVMKQSGGKANPQIAQQIIKKMLSM